MNQQPSPESLELIADYSVKAVLRQLSDGDTLAGRGYQVAGFASVLMGLASVGAGGEGWLRAIIGAYVLAVLAAFMVALPLRFETPGSPRGLWESNWHNEPRDIQHALIKSCVIAYEANMTSKRIRTVALLVALGAMALEAGMVGVRLL